MSNNTPEVVSRGNSFLHGYLIIGVNRASKLPDMDNWYSKLHNANAKDVTDPFVDVRLGNIKIASTRVIGNNLNPIWNEKFKIDVCHSADKIVFDIRDKDHLKTEVIGTVEIDAFMMHSVKMIEDWFDVRMGEKNQGKLHVSIEYVDVKEIKKTFEVESYFPVQKGCRVTLYQDAHCPSHIPCMNLVDRPTGQPYIPQDCWRDLYYAIEGAENLICITGWGVWVKLRLLRGDEALSIYGGTLGELLVKKCNEGVRVQIMIWSEALSGEGILPKDGMFGTHDTETYNYFKQDHLYMSYNRVICALIPRATAKKHLTDVVKNKMSSVVFSHHQKSVIVDAGCPQQQDGRRKLVAFVGGLDLTDGRYDNPGHDLFATLTTDHSEDFYNGCVSSLDSSVGPRQPWHDIHCRVEGPIAKDVLQNFTERWQRQALSEGPPPILHIKFINSFAVTQPDDPKEKWNTQLFRSITADTAILKERNRDELLIAKNKGTSVEHSITRAYTQAIRSARDFIYIENQYFMGSAYNWLQDQNIKCHHTIPNEITTKICDKIHAGERFSAYIVIPMHPEGDPAQPHLQTMLAWQKRTIEMMYKDIGDALSKSKVPSHLGTHPTDWLLFLCPGKREIYGPHMDLLDTPAEGSPAQKLREKMRFMIYVHSKMMIVDDSYILIGSANLNERSMAGSRDTEIAVGSWQPHYDQDNPCGEINMFRMSLFAEHLASSEEEFKLPGSLDCVARVKQMTWLNWQTFNFDYYGLPQETPTPGQLLMYPIKVDQDGSIKNLDGFVSFPDYPSAAKVFGTKFPIISEKLAKITT